MSEQQQKVYMAIDLKSFYASVECVERGLNPLTTNLVVADNSRTEKTICLAVTPSLKAYGISGRARLFEVQQRCKEIKRQTGKELEYITAVPRMALYMKYSAKIYGIYLKYFSSEDIHVYSIDEVFIDATPYLKLYNMDAKTLCGKVIKNVLEETGITATAGIAPNLFLCKVAMDIVAKKQKADENGVRIAQIDEIEFRKQLWDHQPLTDFWRIGPGTVRRLKKNLIFTLGDLARASLNENRLNMLYKTFGVDAEILIDHAWGYENVSLKDIKAYKSQSNSLTTGQVLHCPYTADKGKLILKEMAELLSLDMVEKNLISSSFTLYIGYDICSVTPEYTGEIAVDPYGRYVPVPVGGTVNFGYDTSSTATIVEGLVKLYESIIDKNLYIRRINITANNVHFNSDLQLELFENPLKDEKETKLQKAAISIQKKYGKNSLLKGMNLEEGGTTIERNSQIGGHKA